MLMSILNRIAPIHLITILGLFVSLLIILEKPNSTDANSASSQQNPQEPKGIIATKPNLDISSRSLDKTIIWFCAGAFGYAAVYTIGKSISDK